MLEQQSDADGKLDLITDMRLEVDDGVRLMSALRDGFNRSLVQRAAPSRSA